MNITSTIPSDQLSSPDQEIVDLQDYRDTIILDRIKEFIESSSIDSDVHIVLN